ncbi:MAG: TAT-variant-translocated molybdopterin oxidoreductase, partial [Rhizobiales bacterium]|nr:TAT-variant-translocated molybdopterin oxidoreductase [Hyphomicrobiales bacterium]
MPPPLDLAAIRARLAGENGPLLWRSLEELAGSPEVRRHLEAEFPDVVEAGAIDRRTWLRLMGASLALGGLAACDGNVVTGAPLLSQPRNTPGHTPGVPLVFATSLELNGFGRGVLVKTQEGRPIKIEGNPLHPASLGATDVFAQAEVLSLYDPDRSHEPRENGEARRFDNAVGFLRALRSDLVASRGRGLHILMPPLASPTSERLSAAV